MKSSVNQTDSEPPNEAEDGADLDRDFVQYYREWAEESPRVREDDTVVMKHKPVEKPGKDGDL